MPFNSQLSGYSRDRIVVSTSRCGRDNPGSNPGYGMTLGTAGRNIFIAVLFNIIIGRNISDNSFTKKCESMF